MMKVRNQPKLRRVSDATETRNPCVIKVILLACFTYFDIFKGVSMIRVDFGPISETVYIDIILNTIIEREDFFDFFMISLCPLLLSNVNGGGSN